ncbi:MAG: hypothetical protein H6578_10865 [Chitinophagales bacterium]|nr:hypothetical protein [Chitinophagales bacterium]
MQYRQKQDRFQLEVTCLDQMVAPDSFARVVDAFVDTLDVKALGFTNHTLNTEGNIPKASHNKIHSSHFR